MCKSLRGGGGYRRDRPRKRRRVTNRTKRRQDGNITSYLTTITSLTKFYVPPVRTVSAIALIARFVGVELRRTERGQPPLTVLVVMVQSRETASLGTPLRVPCCASCPLYPTSGEDLHIDHGGRGFTTHPASKTSGKDLSGTIVSGLIIHISQGQKAWRDTPRSGELHIEHGGWVTIETTHDTGIIFYFS